MSQALAFKPARLLSGAYRQTLWANYAPRPSEAPQDALCEILELPTEDDDRIRAHWWHRADPAPVLVLLHGLTGCAASPNVVGLAVKAVARGFSVVRADLRNASGDTPSRHVGHAGRSEDLRTLIEHVRGTVPGQPIGVIGYSLGGNISLKAAGEYGAHAPPELRAIAVVSVPIDLDAACRLIDTAPNWPYRQYFLARLGRTVARHAEHEPHLYADVRLDGVRTLRGFDNAVVATTCGFRDAEHYYRSCSAIRFVESIRVPTLLIHAKDDPFVPIASYSDPRLEGNAAVALLSPARGGHVGFYAAAQGFDPDAFWAENRALDHCAAAVGLPGRRR